MLTVFLAITIQSQLLLRKFAKFPVWVYAVKFHPAVPSIYVELYKLHECSK